MKSSESIDDTCTDTRELLVQVLLLLLVVVVVVVVVVTVLYARIRKPIHIRKAEGRAAQFVASIMADYETIPGSDGMSVLRSVVNLETAEWGDIVVRNITESFWRACIDKVNTPDMRYRVCAVGTPGIGKTTSTPILIRMLLKAGHTVVYLIRAKRTAGWYYEFKRVATSNVDAVNVAVEVEVNVYPETLPYFEIDSLRNPSTYFVVDPGVTKDDCVPDHLFLAKVILVSSPDEGHWGESEFSKRRDKVEGFFKYFPLWSLEELQSAQPTIGQALTKGVRIEDRYRQVGGVPRHVFASDSSFKKTLVLQDDALHMLTEEYAVRIAKGELDAVESMSRGQPKSALIGYQVFESDTGPFEKKEVVVISALVAEKVYSKFMKKLWATMLDPQVNGWKIFEAYTRCLMATGTPKKLEGRPCVGKCKDEYKKPSSLTLGGCKEIRLGHNIVNAAKEDRNVLFHSVDQSYELIDFLYQDDNGHFHAFQATLGKTHSANVAKIKELENAVGISVDPTIKLSLYYLVPGERFEKFVTDPANPREMGATCSIWHVSIPDPNGNG